MDKLKNENLLKISGGGAQEDEAYYRARIADIAALLPYYSYWASSDPNVSISEEVKKKNKEEELKLLALRKECYDRIKQLKKR